KVMQPLAKQIVIFFFSSRRRHTRSLRDWSSDVCSSDLANIATPSRQLKPISTATSRTNADAPMPARTAEGHDPASAGPVTPSRKIGRASYRERVYISVVAVSIKNKLKKDERTTVLVQRT